MRTLALLLVAMLMGCTPYDEVRTLTMRWKLTSNTYQFCNYTYHTYHKIGKRTIVTTHHGTRWEWQSCKVKEGADWEPKFPQVAYSSIPVVGAVEVRNDGEEYYINGLYMGHDRAAYLRFRGEDITRVKIHHNWVGWRSVEPLILEKP